MVALNFSAQFADLVQNRTKKQTIRKPAKNGSCQFEPGDSIQLYTGNRTEDFEVIPPPEAKKITKHDPVVTLVKPVLLDNQRPWWGNIPVTDIYQVNYIARLDGFENYQQMWNWFRRTHKLKNGEIFAGYLIAWNWP